jgi:TetR/AcrR family transcriptional repressor of nem operon
MGRKKAYERGEVLERALELFWSKGFEGTHLQELVEHTGLNRFSLYKEFGGKEGLFDEAMGLYVDRAIEILDHLKVEPLGTDNILTFFRETSTMFMRQGCFAINTFSEKNIVSKKTYERTQTWGKLFEEELEKNLLASRNRGELREGVDIPSTIKFLTAVDTGTVTMSINCSKETIDQIVTVLETFIDSIRV